MTFFEDLRRELAGAGIEPRRIRRIVLELEDHLGCDPEAKLGEPAEIAARFASELRVGRTRRATLGGFAALVVSACAVAASSVAISSSGGWPDLAGARGVVVPVAGLIAAFAGQVSFVAGVLGVALWLLRDDPWLVQRRMAVALAAAWVVVVANGVDAIALRAAVPGWWFVLAGSATLVSATALTAAAQALGRATALTPRRFRRPAAGWDSVWVLAVGFAAVAAMTLGSTVAERSWVEGAFRGCFEVVAFAFGWLGLGRVLGLRHSAA